jgi:hypothetical protein
MDTHKQHSSIGSLLFLLFSNENGLTEVKQQDVGLEIGIVAGRHHIPTYKTPFQKLLPMPQAVSNNTYSNKPLNSNRKQLHYVCSNTFDN